ncbi:LexA repressor [compost metagenome]
MSVTILGPLAEGGVQLPFYSFKVPAGFPSPAADHLEQHISLDELLGIRAPHIYLVRIEGHSMEGAGIFDGDMAVVDRSITAEHGHIVIAAVNCEPVCKRLCKRGPSIILMSENVGYPPRYILEGDELIIWGVVTFSVRAHDPKA